MCVQRLFASDAHLVVGHPVGVVVGLHPDQSPVDPAPFAGWLQAVVALVATVDEYPEAGVEARTSSFRDLR